MALLSRPPGGVVDQFGSAFDYFDEYMISCPLLLRFFCFYGWWREWIRIPIFFPPWNRLHGKIIGLKRRCDVTFVCKGSPPHPESLFEFHFSGGGFSNVISRNSSIFITCSIKWIGGEEGSFFISKTSMIGFVAFNIEPFCYITW